MKQAWARHIPEAVLAAAALAAWWLMRGWQVPADVGWQLWVARQMLVGTRLYADIWEVNPPLWFWSAVPVAWLAERSGMAASAVLTGAVLAFGALCAGLVGRLLETRNDPERLAVMLVAFAVTLMLPAALRGQREHLALIASLPYAGLIARRHAGRPAAFGLAIAVALIGSYGFALKHYFVMVPLVLEAWLMLRERGNWRPWRPELLVLAGLAGAYAAAVMILTPGFSTVMMPMVGTAYFAAQQTLFATAVKPYVLFWLVAGLFLWLTRRLPLRAASPASEAAFPAMLPVWFAFALGYFLQSRGWNYHSIAASGAMAMALGLRLLRLRSVPAVILGSALLFAVVLRMYPYRPQAEPEDPYLDRVAGGEGVFMAGFDASPVWGRGRDDLVWVSRSYSYWMVYAIALAEADGRMTPQLRTLRAQVLAAASQDVRCNPPALILLQATPGVPGRAGQFSLDEFVMRDPALRRFVAAHYAPAERDKGMTAYFQLLPASRDPGLDCRDIY